MAAVYFKNGAADEEERKILLDYKAKDDTIIDVFVGAKMQVHAYLVWAKLGREKCKDLRFAEFDEQQEQFHKESRKRLFEEFINNKYFDAPLVEKMLSFERKSRIMDLHLSLSDISDEGFYDGRLAYVYNQLVLFLGAEEKEAERVVQGNLQVVDEIVGYAKNGYTLRFWCSYNNEHLCSLYYLMHRLRGIECPILLLSLPRKIRKANGRLKSGLRAWEQLSLELIGFAISQSKPHFITAAEKENYAQIWDKLRKENSAIRITGALDVESVPIDYYFDMIEDNCPKNKPFKLVSLLSRIYKNEKKRDLDLFPYYFWATQFYILIEKGIFCKGKAINDLWGYNCWVEYEGSTGKHARYVLNRLLKMDCNPLTILELLDDFCVEESYKVLKENPTISKEEFLSVMEIEEDIDDYNSFNLKKYKYSFCEKCGQLVDKMDYRERKYCRYCENPTEETLDRIGAIWEKAMDVMSYLLEINAEENIIVQAVADRNLEKSYQLIRDDENVGVEEFIKALELQKQ